MPTMTIIELHETVEISIIISVVNVKIEMGGMGRWRKTVRPTASQNLSWRK